MSYSMSYKQASIQHLRDGRGFSEKDIDRFIKRTKSDFNKENLFLDGNTNRSFFNMALEEEYYYGEW